jgi:hypothetical protein
VQMTHKSNREQWVEVTKDQVTHYNKYYPNFNIYWLLINLFSFITLSLFKNSHLHYFIHQLLLPYLKLYNLFWLIINSIIHPIIIYINILTKPKYQKQQTIKIFSLSPKKSSFPNISPLPNIPIIYPNKKIIYNQIPSSFHGVNLKSFVKLNVGIVTWWAPGYSLFSLMPFLLPTVPLFNFSLWCFFIEFILVPLDSSFSFFHV